MKHLRQYIRQILLTEGMKTADELPDGFVVVIKQIAPGHYAVYYGKQDDQSHRVLNSVRAEGGPWGRVSFGKPWLEEEGNCDGALKVGGANANPGWGPLLYDIAIEYATQNANGLIADRDSVSGEAHTVWDYYMHNRKDVTQHQLDNLTNDLTPEIEEDNCDQRVAGDRDRRPRLFVGSSLSKRYTKEPTTINSLKAAGKLVML